MAKRGAVTAEADTDDTGSVDSANERDMEALREAEKPAKREEPADDEPPLEFAEAGDDDDDGEPAQPVERPSRRERRGNRYREAMERAERAEQAAAAQAQRLAALEQQLRMGAPQQQPDQGPSMVERYDHAIEQSQTEQVELSNLYQVRMRELNNQMTAEETQTWLRRSNVLRDREQQLRIEKVALQSGYRPQQQQENPVVAVLRAEYHDVEGHPGAKAYARAYYQAKAAEGVPESLALLKEALNYGREWLGNGGGQPPRPGGKTPKPTKESQSRYTGSAPGASPARAAPTSQTTGKAVLPDGLTKKEFERMADKMYSHIKDDAQRRTKYYREVVEPSMRQGD